MTSVFVMPLRTWLAGDFRTTWGGEASAPPRRRREQVVVDLRESLLSSLQPVIGRPPEWDESGSPQMALALSAHSFSLPFLLARRWSYRLKLPNLCALEGAQLWIPESFESALSVTPPWSEEETLMVASLPQVSTELARLRDHLEAEESLEAPEVQDGFHIAGRLREAAAKATAMRMPVIVED